MPGIFSIHCISTCPPSSSIMINVINVAHKRGFQDEKKINYENGSSTENANPSMDERMSR
jgi:hypothetical protein